MSKKSVRRTSNHKNAAEAASRRHRALRVESLEPRTMLSASTGVLGADFDFRAAFESVAGHEVFAASRSIAAHSPESAHEHGMWYVPPGEDGPILFDDLDSGGGGSFSNSGNKWNQPGGPGADLTITYSYSNLYNGGLNGGLNENELRAATEEALGLWATYAPLHFVEIVDSGPTPSDSFYSASGRPQIRIGHHFIDGGSGSNVLAHAYYPYSTSDGLAGDLHFDNSNNWDTHPSGGTDILEVMTHELGHALGLGHYNSVTAIMNSFYGARYSGLGTGFLYQDDINGIRNIYGTGVGSVTPISTGTDDNYEENDGFASATDPNNNGGAWEQTWLSSIDGLAIQNDSDWYEINVGPSGDERVLIEAEFTHADGNINIALHDASGQFLRSSSSATDNESIDYVVSGPGTYFIRVYGQNLGNTYDLWWDDVQLTAPDDNYEENDSLAAASDPQGNGGAWSQTPLSAINGLGVQSDDDWYEIDVLSGEERVQVDATFTDADGDIDIALHDAAGAIVASSTSATDNESIDFSVAAPGTYYIRVYGANAGNSYDLSWNGVSEDVLNFNDYTLSSYGSTWNQDGAGTVSVEDGGSTLRLNGNRWQKIDFPYTITSDTILEFDFSSSAEGEIHGIGFDTNNAESANSTFQLYGSDVWNNSIQSYNSYGGGGVTTHYTISAGLFLSGQMNYLTFVMDDDGSAAGESVFSNVRIYEGEAGTINFNDFTPSSYGSRYNQDGAGTVTVEDGGDTLRLSGNRWQKIDFPYNVTSSTIIEFDFASTSQGEIHGIGFDTDTAESAEKTFQLFGTDVWNNSIQLYNTYDGSGSVTHYTISAGLFLSGQMNYLTFVMDDDAAAAGESVFSNVRVYEGAAGPINFNDFTLTSYGSRSNQDGVGTVAVEDGGTTLRLTGNRWQKINLPYNVTANTMLEFDFSSSTEGEIHGIGFDDDNKESSDSTFQLFGTQTWSGSSQTYNNYPGSGVTHYTISVGDFISGQMNYLTFTMDDDAAEAGESVFSNVRVYESTSLLTANAVRGRLATDILEHMGPLERPSYPSHKFTAAPHATSAPRNDAREISNTANSRLHPRDGLVDAYSSRHAAHDAVFAVMQGRVGKGRETGRLESAAEELAELRVGSNPRVDRVAS